MISLSTRIIHLGPRGPQGPRAQKINTCSYLFIYLVYIYLCLFLYLFNIYFFISLHLIIYVSFIYLSFRRCVSPGLGGNRGGGWGWGNNIHAEYIILHTQNTQYYTRIIHHVIHAEYTILYTQNTLYYTRITHHIMCL